MIVGWLTGGLLQALLKAFVAMQERRLESRGLERKLAADLAAEEIRAEIASRAEARKLLQLENGTLLSAGRLGRLAFVLPLALWWAAVCLDSVFHFGWKVSEVPVLRDWGGAIVTSLFLVDGMKTVGRMVRGGRA